MAIFTAIAAAVVTALGITGTAATIFTVIGSTLLSVGASRLLMKRQMKGGSSGGNGGSRIQLPPATENKLPVIYGSAFVGGSVTDAKISQDNKTMWYCVAMAEVTDTGAYTFDTSNIYYNGLKVNFGFNGADVVGQNTYQTAQQVMQDVQIPVGQRWTATDLMSNTAFAIIRVKYNAEKGTTSLGGVTARLTNSLSEPGSCIKDYMENTRYGCAIPTDQIDTASLTALDVYSAEDIVYGADPATDKQARYRLDGPLATGTDCLSNLQIMVDSADSWLQYDEFAGKWSVIINQSYTDYTTIGSLFLIDSSNLVGGIDVAPINLNETFNQLEVAYPNASIRDQTDYQLIKLQDYVPGVMSPNEAVNKLDVDYPIVNNSVQSIYLGVRRLLQGREDLTVSFQLDYSGIQIQAGDVIRIKQEVYGWDTLSSGLGKLFRVANVSEEKYSDGSLGVRVSAFEYNDTIYADRAILDFQPDPNLGIANPNIFDTPLAPRVYLNQEGSIRVLNITGTVPNLGLTNYLDFNYGNSADVTTHAFYSTRSNANGDPLTANIGSDELLIGKEYSILTLGTTNWTSIGASVVDLGTRPNPGSFMIAGKQYIIFDPVNTDFTLWGAPDSNIGTIFVATGIGSGAGSVYPTDFIATGTDAGTGTVSTIFTVEMTDLVAGDYYWSVTAKNDQQGKDGPASSLVTWAGPSVTNVQTLNLTNVSTAFGGSGWQANYSPTVSNLATGGSLLVLSADSGDMAPETYITQIVSPTSFLISNGSTVPLANGTVSVTYTNSDSDLGSNNGDDSAGGVTGGEIKDGTITFDNLGPGTGAALSVGNYVYVAANTSTPTGSTTAPVNWNTTIGSGGNLTLLDSTDAFNITKFVTSTANLIDPNYINPYMSGYSTVANGFFETSLAPFQPAYTVIWSGGSGDDMGGNFGEVWPVEYKRMTLNGTYYNVPANDFIELRYQAGLFCNVDCKLSYGSFITTPGLDTQQLFRVDDTHIIDLQAGEITNVDLTEIVALQGGAGLNGAGIYWRILTSDAQVTSIRAGIRIYDTRIE